MAVISVSLAGNDGTGSGSVMAPYRTVFKAVSVAVSGDVIDVGEGTFEETTALSIVVADLSIRGRGYAKTTIEANITTAKFIDINAGAHSRTLIANLHLKQKSDSLTMVNVTDASLISRVIIARCLVTLRNGVCVNNDVASSPNLRVDLLHCIVRGATTSRQAKAFRSVVVNGIAAYNCIFANLALVVDDVNGGQPCELNYNLYYFCERLFRVGDLGQQDIVDVDPKFLGWPTNLGLAADSKLNDAGLDVSQGYGTPRRSPPSELNWGYEGEYPDIGLVEQFRAQAAINTFTFNFHLILAAISRELSRVDGLQTQTKADRSLDLASASELYKRWGVFLDAIRPATMPTDTYRELLTKMLALYRYNAPARVMPDEVILRIFDLISQVEEYYKSPRFRITTELKLKVVTPVPSLTVNLTGGLVHVDLRLFRVMTQNIAIPMNTTQMVYVDGDTVTDDVTALVKLSTDTSLRRGFRIVSLAGTATFRNGSLLVTGVGTSFSSLTEHDRIRPSGTTKLFTVASVSSDTELELRDAFDGLDITATLEHARTVHVLSEVTTNGTTVTAIRSVGNLGHTTWANSAETKGHGYHLVLDDGGGTSIFDNTDEVRLLVAQLRRSKPIHKLLYVSFVDDLPQGLLITTVDPIEQSSVTYLDDFEDSSWEPV